MNEHSDQSELLNELAEEFIERYRRGERPAIDEFESRCPEHAEEIRELFPTLVAMEQASPSETSIANHRPVVFSSERPQKIGEYRILKEVGRGGMGIVYEAEQVSLGRRVALKVLPQHLMASEQQQRRFQREAGAAAKLHHTNIVPVFGVGECDGIRYYVMQFIPGCGLDAVLQQLRRISEMHGGIGADLPTNFEIPRQAEPDPTLAPNPSVAALAETLISGVPARPIEDAEQQERRPADGDDDTQSDSQTVVSSASVVLPRSSEQPGESAPSSYWHSVARIGLQVADALDHAHGQGILHRDIKPSNLLLDTVGTVWITDFGLAKSEGQDNLTNTGDILGTLRYMAPEMFDEQADARSDIYALGLCLYELLALRPAYNDSDRNRLVKSVMSAAPERLERVDRKIPNDLVTVVHKAIDSEPDKRYQTARELAADLRRFVADEPIHARRVSTFEQFLRWARHNKAVAVSMLLVAMLVLATAIGASIASVRFERLATKNANLVKITNEANRCMELALADVYCSHGLIAAAIDEPLTADQKSDSSIAALWFANAVSLSERDPTRERANRVRAHNWLNTTHHPVYAYDHQASFSRVECHPDGDFVAIASGQTIRAWNWRTEKPIDWLDGRNSVTAARWSDDGSLLAVSIYDPQSVPAEDDSLMPPTSTIQVFSFPQGDQVYEWNHPAKVNTLAFSEGGDLLAAASDVIQVFNMKTKSESADSWQTDAPVRAMRFFAGDQRLLIATRDRKAGVYAINDADSQATTGPLFAPVEHRPLTPGVPAIVDEGRGLITVAGGGRRLQWRDAETGKLTRWQHIAAGVGPIRVLVASDDGTAFAVGGHASAKLWRIEKGQDQEPVLLPHKNHLTSLSFSSDGQRLITGSWDGFVKYWSLDGARVGQPLWHQGKVLNATILSNDNHILTIQQDGLLRIWRPATEQLIHFELAYPGGSMTAQLDPNGLLTIPARFDHFGWDYDTRTTRVYNVESGLQVGQDLKLTGRFRDAAISHDQKLVAVTSRIKNAKNVLQVFRIEDGTTVFPAIEVVGDPQAVTFDPQGTHVAVLCDTGPICIYDSTDGMKTLSLEAAKLHGGPSVRSLHYVLAGQAILALSPKGIGVWDAQTGKLRYPLLTPGGSTTKIAIAPDGKTLATGTQGSAELRVWSLATGKPLCDPIPHADDVFDVSFGPGGNVILTAGRNGQVRLINWAQARDVCSLCVAKIVDGLGAFLDQT